MIYLDYVLSTQMSAARGEALHHLALGISKAIASNLREREREVKLLAQSLPFQRGGLDSPELRRSLEDVKQMYQ